MFEKSIVEQYAYNESKGGHENDVSKLKIRYSINFFNLNVIQPIEGRFQSSHQPEKIEPLNNWDFQVLLDDFKVFFKSFTEIIVPLSFFRICFL